MEPLVINNYGVFTERIHDLLVTFQKIWDLNETIFERGNAGRDVFRGLVTISTNSL